MHTASLELEYNFHIAANSCSFMCQQLIRYVCSIFLGIWLQLKVASGIF